MDTENAYRLSVDGTEIKRIAKDDTVIWQRAIPTEVAESTDFTPSRTNSAVVNISGETEYAYLPDGFTQLEYVGSTGSSYILTGYVVNYTNLTLEYKYMKTSNLQQSALGVDKQSSPRLMHGHLWNGVGYYGDSSIVTIGETLNVAKTVKFEIGNTLGYGQWIVDGTVYKGSSLNGWTDENTSANTVQELLFGTTNSSGGASQLMTGRIYYARYYHDGVLERNFVPAMNGAGIIGFYETVTGTFLTNGGSGTFTAGPEVPRPMMYQLPSGYTRLTALSGSGTQYIELPTKFEKTDEIMVETMVTNTSSLKYLVASSEWLGTARFTMAGNANGKRGFSYGSAYSSATIYANPYVTYNSRRAVERYKDYKFTYSDGSLQSSVDVSKISFTGASGYIRLFYGYNSVTAGVIYSFTHKKNGKYVEVLVPAKRDSDSVLGMYDLVNNVFYTNKGTGTFSGSEPTASTLDNPIKLVSVGDKTNNICDIRRVWTGSTRTLSSGEEFKYYEIALPYGVYTVSTNCKDNTSASVATIFACNGSLGSGTISSSTLGVFNSKPRTVVNTTGKISVGVRSATTGDYVVYPTEASATADNLQIMVAKGSSATDWEQYGYKVPITVGDTTQTIYLDQPLHKLGDFADTLTINENVVSVNRIIDQIELGGDFTMAYSSSYSSDTVDTFSSGKYLDYAVNGSASNLFVQTHGVVGYTSSGTEFQKKANCIWVYVGGTKPRLWLTFDNAYFSKDASSALKWLIANAPTLLYARESAGTEIYRTANPFTYAKNATIQFSVGTDVKGNTTLTYLGEQ